ncbi:hypothetical protein GCM10020255_078820 [Rhodococcus baikonurensis]
MRTDTGPRAERNGSVITVALVDDHAAIRSGLAMILRQHDDIDVVAEAETERRRSPSHARINPTSC